MDTLDAMRVFVRVAEAGHFAAAARQLDLAPASVTRAVQHLEARLGARLFHRSTRKVLLTESGERFVVAARQSLAALGAAHDDIRAQRDGAIEGVLRISLPVSLGLRHLVPLLARFAEQHPRLQLDVDVSDHYVDLVGGGFDAAIRIARQLPDSELSARRIGESPEVLAASPEYLRRRGAPRDERELAAHALLLYTHAPVRAAAGEAATIASGAPVRSNSGEALRAFAVAGLGIVRSPLFLVAADLAAGRLARVLPALNLGGYTAWVVFAHREHLPAKTRGLIDFLAAQMPDLGALPTSVPLPRMT